MTVLNERKKSKFSKSLDKPHFSSLSQTKNEVNLKERKKERKREKERKKKEK